MTEMMHLKNFKEIDKALFERDLEGEIKFLKAKLKKSEEERKAMGRKLKEVNDKYASDKGLMGFKEGHVEIMGNRQKKLKAQYSLLLQTYIKMKARHRSQCEEKDKFRRLTKTHAGQKIYEKIIWYMSND